MSTKSGAHLQAPSATQGRGNPPFTHRGCRHCSWDTGTAQPPRVRRCQNRGKENKILLGAEGKHIHRNIHPTPKRPAARKQQPPAWYALPLAYGFPSYQAPHRGGRERGSPRPARRCKAQLDPAQPGSARLGPARLGSARLGPARPGSARHGSARLGTARLGMARSGSARLGTSRLVSALTCAGRAPPPRTSSRGNRGSPAASIGRSAGRRRGRVRLLRANPRPALPAAPLPPGAAAGLPRSAPLRPGSARLGPASRPRPPPSSRRAAPGAGGFLPPGPRCRRRVRGRGGRRGRAPVSLCRAKYG